MTERGERGAKGDKEKGQGAVRGRSSGVARIPRLIKSSDH